MKSLVSVTGRPFLVLVVLALTVFSSKHEPTWMAGANSAPDSTRTASRPSKGPSKEMISTGAGFRPEAFWRGRDAASLFLPGAALMGCTTPSFAPSVGSPFPAGSNPHFAGVGLFNADNHLDVAVPDANSG